MQKHINNSILIKAVACVLGLTAFFSAQAQPTLNIPYTPGQSTASVSYPGIHNLNSNGKYNYVRSQVPDVPVYDWPGSSNFLFRQSTNYFDGLGRPLQTVIRKGHLGGNDLVNVKVYDSVGRERYQYLPYAAPTGGLLFLTGPGLLKVNDSTQMRGFYEQAGPDEQPYGRVDFDNTPMNRPVRQLAPGRSWVGTNRAVEYDYKTNSVWPYTAMITYSITGGYPRWTIGSAANAIPQYQGDYAAGQLYITSTTDEDGKTSFEMKDKQGRVVIKMAALTSAAWGYTQPKDYAYTCYVYDDLGRLRCVMPPEAAKPQAISGSFNVTWSLNQSRMNGLCYTYFYDNRNRTVEKKIPGKELEYYVYDRRDRMVFFQDGKLRGQNKWSFTFYDLLNRPTVTGLTDLNAARSTVAANAYANPSGIASNSVYYYTNNYNHYNAYPTSLSNCTFLSYNYYDDYSQLSTFTFDPSQFDNEQPNNQPHLVVPQLSSVTRGFLTGAKVRIMDPDNPTANNWLSSVNYYDEKGRVIQTQAQNHKNALDISSNIYFFQGMLWKNILSHNNPSALGVPGAVESPTPLKSTKIVKTFERNLLTGGGNDQVKQVTEKINGGIDYPYAYYGYDHLGRQTLKGSPVGYVKQWYNIRGFLNHIEYESNTPINGNAILFDEKLSYDYGFTEKYYNGNIAGIIWSGSLGKKEAYGYSYDQLNRLTHAEYRENSGTGWNNNTYDYTASNIAYDLNGNLSSMNHKTTVAGATSPIPMDQLTYQYAQNSNQLIKVTDGILAAATSGLPDFKDGINLDVEYTYDANGNMVTDGNKKITSITYNHLNKPEKITVQNQGVITYVYDAAGNRLIKKIVPVSGPAEVYDYIGNFVYKDNLLQYVLNEEGRARPVANDTTGYLTKFVHDYFVKDHLGNVRSVIAAQPMSMQYFASHEVGSYNIEHVLFDNIQNVWATNPDGSPGNVMAAELNADKADERIGTAIMLHTMPGDQFNISVKSYYEGENIPEETVEPDDVLSSLFSALTGGMTYGGVPVTDLPDNLNTIQTALGNPSLASQIAGLPVTNADPSAPKAYLNILFFDDKMALIPGASKKIQVAPSTGIPNWQILNGNGNIGTTVLCPNCPSGLVLIYIDNQSIGKTVWFDDLFIGHYNSKVLEENHYYPYGLTLSKDAGGLTTGQPYKLTTKELETKFDLNTYDFGARMQDMQLGRWCSVDPLAANYYNLSPYNYCGNNPTIYIDEDGKEIKNADKIRKEQAQQTSTRLNKVLNDAKEKYGSVDKRKDFKGTDEQWKRVEDTKNRLKGADKDVATFTYREKASDQALAEWKERSPNLYKKLDESSVDVMFGVEDIFDAQNVAEGVVGGRTSWINIEDGVIITEFGPNTINITLDDSKTDRDAFKEQKNEYTDNHEGGHADYIINNATTYGVYYNNLIKNGENPHGGHRSDDQSGKTAHEYGKKKDID